MYGVWKIASDWWSKSAVGTSPCFESFFFVLLHLVSTVLLFWVFLTFFFWASFYDNIPILFPGVHAGIPRKGTGICVMQGIGNMVSAPAVQNCCHQKTKCLRRTTNSKMTHKASARLLRNNTSLFTVREIKPNYCGPPVPSGPDYKEKKKKVTVFPFVCQEWLLPASRQSFQLVDISSSVRPNSLLA